MDEGGAGRGVGKGTLSAGRKSHRIDAGLIDHDERNRSGVPVRPHRWALVLRRRSASPRPAAPDSNTPRPPRNPRRGHRQHRHAAVHDAGGDGPTTYVRILRLTQMGSPVPEVAAPGRRGPLQADAVLFLTEAEALRTRDRAAVGELVLRRLSITSRFPIIPASSTWLTKRCWVNPQSAGAPRVPAAGDMIGPAVVGGGSATARSRPPNPSTLAVSSPRNVRRCRRRETGRAAWGCAGPCRSPRTSWVVPWCDADLVGRGPEPSAPTGTTGVGDLRPVSSAVTAAGAPGSGTSADDDGRVGDASPTAAPATGKCAVAAGPRPRTAGARAGDTVAPVPTTSRRPGVIIWPRR